MPAHVLLPRFFIASSDPARATREKRGLLNALVGEKASEEHIKKFFFEKTRELMQRESCQVVGGATRTVDLVRDVLKVVPVYWVCDIVSDIDTGRVHFMTCA